MALGYISVQHPYGATLGLWFPVKNSLCFKQCHMTFSLSAVFHLRPWRLCRTTPLQLFSCSELSEPSQVTPLPAKSHRSAEDFVAKRSAFISPQSWPTVTQARGSSCRGSEIRHMAVSTVICGTKIRKPREGVCVKKCDKLAAHGLRPAPAIGSAAPRVLLGLRPRIFAFRPAASKLEMWQCMISCI